MDKLMIFRGAALAALLTLNSACTRPQAVRDVASASRPLVVDIQRSGSALQQRMAAQRQSFESRAARLAGLVASARGEADSVEQDWRLLANDRQLKQLTVLRERDSQILANPLAPVTVSAAIASKPDAVDLAGLKRTVAALDRLSGAERMNRAEFLDFVRAVNTETVKLANQSDPAAE